MAKTDPRHSVVLGTGEWTCSCRQWSMKLPPVRGFSDTTAEARAAQMQFAHDAHVRRASKKSNDSL